LDETVNAVSDKQDRKQSSLRTNERLDIRLVRSKMSAEQIGWLFSFHPETYAPAIEATRGRR
jgi:hypothetical protein